MRLGLAPKARLVRRAPTGERLLVYPERALALNASAAEIIELLDGERSLDQIVSLLGERHPDASAELLHAAVARVVSELEQRALLQIVP